MACQHRSNLILAYVSFFAAIGFSLLVPRLFGDSIDQLVKIDGEQVVVLAVEWSTLIMLALFLLGANLARGFSDFARTYASDALSHSVSFDLRNLLYDKLQQISFAYHDKEHTGNLMSKATSDVEAIRRFINLGLVRSLDVVVRIVAITGILLFLNWKLALLSLIFVPFIVLRSTLVLRRLRRMWLHVQEVIGETVTVLQENLVGIHVVKAFASEEYEKEKYRKKLLRKIWVHQLKLILLKIPLISITGKR